MNEPLNIKLHDDMTALAQALDELLNAGKTVEGASGFVMLVFPFANLEKGDMRCNYISNVGDRKAIACVLRELIARFEGQPNVKGHA